MRPPYLNTLGERKVCHFPVDRFLGGEDAFKKRDFLHLEFQVDIGPLDFLEKMEILLLGRHPGAGHRDMGNELLHLGEIGGKGLAGPGDQILKRPFPPEIGVNRDLVVEENVQVGGVKIKGFLLEKDGARLIDDAGVVLGFAEKMDGQMVIAFLHPVENRILLLQRCQLPVQGCFCLPGYVNRQKQPHSA